MTVSSENKVVDGSRIVQYVAGLTGMFDMHTFYFSINVPKINGINYFENDTFSHEDVNSKN